MLAELTIQDIALIDAARLEFGPGLNLLTGETGAGKSILIDALTLALGERAQPDRVRQGANAGQVDAVFVFPPDRLPKRLKAVLQETGLDVDEDGQLILTREVARAGRSTARINGRPVTAAVLRQVGAALVEIHGQNDNPLLSDPAYQLDLFDALAGDQVGRLRRQLSEEVDKLRAIDRQQRTWVAGDERQRAREMDLLRYQMEEIDAVAPQPGEDEELAERRRLLSGAERLAQSLATAYDALYAASSSAADGLAAAARALEEASTIDHNLKELAQRVRSLGYEVEEAARDVRARSECIEHDPAQLAAVEERLARLQQLKRKYGDTLQAVLDYRREIENQLRRLERAQECLAELEEQRAQVLARAVDLARQLHAARQAAAQRLEQQLRPILAELGLAGAGLCFAVELQRATGGVPWDDGDPVRLTATGVDRVQFQLAPNPGEPPRPLARAASGGERSRVMLALRSLQVDAEDVPTVVFDEVDAGVGGETAWAVGQRLARIAGSRQVLCVTHLAPICALADRHFAVYKETHGNRTLTRVRLLQEEERLEELARMLGTGAAGRGKEAARLLLERARQARRAG